MKSRITGDHSRAIVGVLWSHHSCQRLFCSSRCNFLTTFSWPRRERVFLVLASLQLLITNRRYARGYIEQSLPKTSMVRVTSWSKPKIDTILSTAPHKFSFEKVYMHTARTLRTSSFDLFDSSAPHRFALPIVLSYALHQHPLFIFMSSATTHLHSQIAHRAAFLIQKRRPWQYSLYLPADCCFDPRCW